MEKQKVLFTKVISAQFERIRPISRWKAKAGSKYNLGKKLCLIKVGLGSKSLKVVTSVN